jgi:hypothetical protein
MVQDDIFFNCLSLSDDLLLFLSRIKMFPKWTNSSQNLPQQTRSCCQGELRNPPSYSSSIRNED